MAEQDKTRSCRICGVDKAIEQFRINVTPTCPRGVRRRVCRKCEKIRVGDGGRVSLLTPTDAKVRVCSSCHEEKPADQFHLLTYRRKDGSARRTRAAKCKACTSRRCTDRHKAIRAENTTKLFKYYEEHPCPCGENNPIKLQADHDDPAEKEFTISRHIGLSWEKIEKELAKCTIRCANCHLVRTAAERGWYRDPRLRDYVMSWPENAAAYNKYKRKEAA